jgi:hypothetical protein
LAQEKIITILKKLKKKMSISIKVKTPENEARESERPIN